MIIKVLESGKITDCKTSKISLSPARDCLSLKVEQYIMCEALRPRTIKDGNRAGDCLLIQSPKEVCSRQICGRQVRRFVVDRFVAD